MTMKGVPRSNVNSAPSPGRWALVGMMFSNPKRMTKLTAEPVSENSACAGISEFSGVGTSGASDAMKAL